MDIALRCHQETKKFSSCKDVIPNALTKLKTALAISLVPVAIEAKQIVFQGYSRGVIISGFGTSLDNGFLTVGYGTDVNAGNFFIVKNS